MLCKCKNKLKCYESINIGSYKKIRKYGCLICKVSYISEENLNPEIFKSEIPKWVQKGNSNEKNICDK